MWRKSGVKARSVVLMITCCALVLGGAGAVSASQDPLGAGSGTVFRLGPESWFQQGCVEPCRCPIMAPQPIRGTLVLKYLGQVEGLETYAVEDVNWTVPLEQPIRIVGTGRYTLGSPGPLPVQQQRLELDLALGEQPLRHLDSGWTPATDPARIGVTVSLDDGTCWNVAIAVDAGAVPEAEMRRYVLSPGSTFQRGCFDPCDCPLGREQSLTGSFALVPLTESWYLTELAVVDVRWDVHAESSAEGASGQSSSETVRVTGFGVYQTSGEVLRQQRLLLDLAVGGEPHARFDSGPQVGGVDLPRIDIAASIHGRWCYDTVLHVIAGPIAGPPCGGIAGLGCAAGEFCNLPIGQCCCDHLGVCTAIPDACPLVWNPVCGCDGATYGNECEAAAAGVSVAGRGPCGGPCSKDADCGTDSMFCKPAIGSCGTAAALGTCAAVPAGVIDVWDPVCGCDGVTYRNELEADANRVPVRHRGACAGGPRIRRQLSQGPHGR